MGLADALHQPTGFVPGTHHLIEYSFRIETPDGLIRDTTPTKHPRPGMMRCPPGAVIKRRERRVTIIVEDWQDSEEDSGSGTG